MKKPRSLAFTSLVFCLIVSPVLADGLPLPPVMMEVSWGEGDSRQAWSVDITDTSSPAVESVTQNPDGTWRLVGGWQPGTPAWACDWVWDIDPDPVVSGGFSFTNVTGAPQNFAVSLTLPAVVPSPAQMRGSISGSLVDAATDGATLQTLAGIPVYTALIDGVSVQTLLNDPYSTSAVGTAAPWGAPAPASFGFMPSGPVAVSIGISHQFNLSGGFDSASFVSRFEVIPEPATIALLLLGIVGVARRR